MKYAGFVFLSCIIVIVLIPSLIIFSRLGSNKNKDEISFNGIDISIYNHRIGVDEKLNFEEYISRVVAGEMPSSFHIEALKAQAVAARTYALKKINSNYLSPQHPNSPICTDSIHCCAYISHEDALQRWGEDKAEEYWSIYKKAVYETQGIVMTYDKKLITAVFHSTASGKTEAAKDVWGSDYPYLQSIESEGDDFSPSYQSELFIPYADFIKALKNENPSFNENNAIIGKIKRTEGGSVAEIIIGDVPFTGTKIRSLFSLKSANFELELTDNQAKFYVTGYGHGVGMSQYGANYMAQNNYSYEDILKKYYKDIKLENIN